MLAVFDALFVTAAVVSLLGAFCVSVVSFTLALTSPCATTRFVALAVGYVCLRFFLGCGRRAS